MPCSVRTSTCRLVALSSTTRIVDGGGVMARQARIAAILRGRRATRPARARRRNQSSPPARRCARPSAASASSPPASVVGQRVEIGDRANLHRLAQPRRQRRRDAAPARSRQRRGGASARSADELHAEVRLQRGEQRFGAHRLRQVVHAAGVARRLARVAERARGHRDHRDVPRRLVGGELARRGEAVEVGHLHVHEDDVGPVRRAPASMPSMPPVAVITCRPALSSRLARMRRLTVLSSTTSAVTCCPGASRAYERRRRSVRRVRRRVIVGAHQRQREVEAAALADACCRRCRSDAHAAQQVPADRQAEPGAAGGRARFGLRERVEDLVELLRLDAGAGVADRRTSARSPSCGDLERAPRPSP